MPQPNTRYAHDDTAILRANRIEAQMRDSLEKARCVNVIAKDRDTLRQMWVEAVRADDFGLSEEVTRQIDRARRYLLETGGVA